MTEILLLICRWVIPPCIAVAVLVRLASPYIAEIKALLPEGFSITRKGPPVDLDREIQRLLDGATR